ncbi:MAG: MFS transporter [Thermodesulfobacteriota bacterium]
MPKLTRPYLTFSILSVLFVLSMFFRVSNAVIAPNLIQDLGLNAETLGILGGAFFYSFALLQIPMGLMLDRIGPRIVMTFFPLIGALGAFLFALGESFTSVLFGRILIGVGMASVLMGTMKVFTLRFPPEKFATLVGINVSIGTLGSIFAASPLAYLASTIGWRMTFIFAGGITTILAILVFWALGGEKKKDETLIFRPSPEPAIGVIQSIRLVLGSLAFWQIGAIAFFRYGTFIGLQGLWLGLYLMEIKGYSPIQTGNVLTFLAIGAIIGGPIAGRLSDRVFHSRKGVALWGLSLYGLSLFPLIGILRIESPFWYGLIFFFIGFFSSFGMLVYPHAKELFPITISATVMAGVNFFTMAGGALFMPALGKVIESFPRVDHTYPPEAYHLSFLICFLGMLISLIFYAFSKREK